jgi:hypothetical protein
MMDWETSKENIIPLKKGRSLAANGIGGGGLGGILQDKLSKEDKSKEYQSRLDKARKGSSSEDLLDIYIDYYSWTRRSSNNDSEKGKSILEVSVTHCLVASIFYLYLL